MTRFRYSLRSLFLAMLVVPAVLAPFYFLKQVPSATHPLPLASGHKYEYVDSWLHTPGVIRPVSAAIPSDELSLDRAGKAAWLNNRVQLVETKRSKFSVRVWTHDKELSEMLATEIAADFNHSLALILPAKIPAPDYDWRQVTAQSRVLEQDRKDKREKQRQLVFENFEKGRRN